MLSGDKKPKIALIAAASLNGVIGASSHLPWRILDRCSNFQRLVAGCPVVMGRKTHESLGGRVIGSRNIVLTTKIEYHPPGVELARSISEILSLTKDEDRIFVIGGARVFGKMFCMADELHITEVNAVVSGHKTFPEIKPIEWKEVRRSVRQTRIGDLMTYCFVDYVRIGHGSKQQSEPDVEDDVGMGEAENQESV